MSDLQKKINELIKNLEDMGYVRDSGHTNIHCPDCEDIENIFEHDGESESRLFYCFDDSTYLCCDCDSNFSAEELLDYLTKWSAQLKKDLTQKIKDVLGDTINIVEFMVNIDNKK